MQKKKLLIAGNWKMHGSKEFIISFLTQLKQNQYENEIAIFPPYVLLPLAKETLADSSIKLGAQDVSAHENGAYTGEVSASMMAEVPCSYVIVGHSERRSFHQESNALITKKALIAYAHQITPIVCFGETEKEREQQLTFEIITQQLRPLFETTILKHCILAYEPVWAIGTGKTATPDQAQAVHQFVRQLLQEKEPSHASQIRILYGGSVKPSNAEALFSMPDIDGGLIGGASLKFEEFDLLCRFH
ncbi:MAG: triosephosphate isomerase [uncultured bacterium]|nr:MAG: triosephosphate isomerase [uncultured bacterium]OGT24924.1 MAG: triose-phosphate isomerase [Gammaproteobacteria bacterium RIFCSPHIGHO2_12_38_15]OGT67853.1 MAG: triose-phosphate isomerase [Gammaproteobacteria bacterium RIFCSPLOWO2_02_FULL_38_11]OGT77606.1 MAG: triose-phosphate isomerase [Gammaproteobacteria bacterium RIFCSPLOWO2_12_FULL_38_14]